MAAEKSGAFFAYHEPDIINILTLISFFLFLATAHWLAEKIICASLIGNIIVGLIYGVPIANILAIDWQATFLVLGYIGLILIIFEGGLTVRLDLLRQNLILSAAVALFGVLTPIALSFGLLYAGFHYALLEAFIVGTSLCSTSLGTTFVVLSSASKNKPKSTSSSPNADANPTAPAVAAGVDFSQTRIGTVLVGAAVLDDVCGLVLVSLIRNLRGVAGDADGGGTSLGWTVGRPVLASGLMAVLTPVVAWLVAGPLYRRFVTPSRLQRAAAAGVAHAFNILLMAAVLCAFLTIAAYAGASVLFGAFLAGAFVSSLPARQAREEGEREIPVFTDSFEHYLGTPQKYVFQPLFFASIGFAIPFVDLWTGESIWKGVVYALLMAFAKIVVGVMVPVWEFISPRLRQRSSGKRPVSGTATWAPATLLGAAMVARGEIGLVIIQIGLNETPFLSQEAFIIGVWAIVLNTIIGPVLVGVLLNRAGASIAENPCWGVQENHGSDTEVAVEAEPTSTSQETSSRRTSA
ncbi:db8fb8e5-cc05-442f-b554-96012710f49b [Thermothielavioides terrestris]|uniref:Db8fb8e5-cc05-442f-b554-96012710f49b n=1 Tax=Thermothielavioides terrestris TaxID=2587410 RepID=A0A446BS76_9PEZI|nr:db8fb8e5-cc05-442f-b554-96012710f49b [Thermothielavioides terrestris]